MLGDVLKVRAEDSDGRAALSALQASAELVMVPCQVALSMVTAVAPEAVQSFSFIASVAFFGAVPPLTRGGSKVSVPELWQVAESVAVLTIEQPATVSTSEPQPSAESALL